MPGIWLAMIWMDDGDVLTMMTALLCFWFGSASVIVL